jgi:hypothetical protein
MRHLRSKVTVLALGALLGVLASPGTASAAAYKQARVCDTGGSSVQVWLAGYNDKGVYTNSRIWDVSAGACQTLTGYWWKTNSGVDVHTLRPNQAWKTAPWYLIESESQVITLY